MKELRDVLRYLSAPAEAEQGIDSDWRCVANADAEESWHIEPPTSRGQPESWLVSHVRYEDGEVVEEDTYGRFAARSLALKRLAEAIPEDVTLRLAY